MVFLYGRREGSVLVNIANSSSGREGIYPRWVGNKHSVGMQDR